MVSLGELQDIHEAAGQFDIGVARSRSEFECSVFLIRIATGSPKLDVTMLRIDAGRSRGDQNVPAAISSGIVFAPAEPIRP
jgi:hypothetical protein